MSNEIETVSELPADSGATSLPDTAQAARVGFFSAAEYDPATAAEMSRLAKIANVPVDTVYQNPKGIKKQVAMDAIDFDALAKTSPATASVIANIDKAKIAHDDINNMSDMENAVTFLGASAKAGGRDLLAVGAKLIDVLNPFTTSDEDLAVLYKNDPEGLKRQREQGGTAVLSRFARNQTEASKQIMEGLPQQTKDDYSSLEYATTDPGKAAYLSPVKMVGDAIRSLPTSAALALTMYITKGAASKAEQNALAQGLSAAEARQAGIQAATTVATRYAAVTEGSVGYGQQALQTQNEVEGMPMSKVEQSPLFKQLVDSGFDPNAAKIYLAAKLGEQSGVGAGIVDAVTSAVGGHYLGKMIGEGGSLLPRMGKGFITEGATEFVQSGGEQLAENATMQQVKPELPLSDKVLESMLQGFAVGSITGSTFSGIAGRAQRDEQKVKAADADAQQIEKINQLSAASEVLKRSPDDFEDFVTQASENGPVNQVYIDANALMQSGVADQVAALSPSVAEQLPLAAETGGQIAIPVGEYSTNIAPSKLAPVLLDHLKADPEGFSRAEAQAYTQSHLDDLRQEIERTIEQKSKDEVFRQSVDTLKQKFQTELDTLGHQTKDVNATNAAYLANFFGVMADKLGITPEELHAKYPVNFASQMQQGYDQAGNLQTDTEAFKNWFGDSKVVDAEGKPLVVYHGTSTGGFNEFDVERTAGSTLMSQQGPGFYFTDEKNAKQYMNHPEKRGEGKAQLFDVFLNIKKPLDITPSSHNIDLEAIKNVYLNGDNNWFFTNWIPFDTNISKDVTNAEKVDAYVNQLAKMGDAELLKNIGRAYRDKQKMYDAMRQFLDADGVHFKDKHGSIYVAWNPTQIKSATGNNGEFDPNNPNVYLQGENRIADEDYRVLRRDVGDLNQEEQVAFDDFVKSRTDGKALVQRLQEHKGTPWARAAMEGIFVRQAIKTYAAGGTPNFQSMFEHKQAFKSRELVKKFGLDGINTYLEATGFVGDAAKPINNVSSSFINCNPSADCAKYCYATEGHYRYANSVIKSELVSFAIEMDPIRSAKRTAAEYKATAEFANNKALRLFDKGDGSAEWLPYIKALNDEGIRVQIFSKVPEFLRQVPDVNLRMLSIDNSNMEMAEQNQDLPVAFVYGGGQEQVDFLAKLVERGQIQVVLPIKLGRKVFTNEQTKALKAEIPGIGKYICPIDGGIKKIGPNSEADKWNCTKCDKNGGLGCFFGKVTETVMKSAEVKPTSAKEKAARILDLRRQINDLTRGTTSTEGSVQLAGNAGTGEAVANTGSNEQGGVQNLLRQVDDLLGELLREYEPDAETRTAFEGNGGTGSEDRGLQGNQSPSGRRTIPIKPVYNQSARGSFNPDTLTISLLKGADLSTFLHETGHFFLEAQFDIASKLQNEADTFGFDTLQPGEQSVLRDTQTLLEWFDVPDLATWYNMDMEQKRAFHEKFAEGFETYLFEGKSPSIQLQSMFQRFRAWLTRVYKDIKSMRIQLTPEVRGVFDRMVASEDEIALAQQARSMLPMFTTAEQAGMSVEEFAAYQAEHKQATDDAIEDLQAKGLRDMQWLQNARSKVLKRLQKEHDELRRAVRAEVRIELMAEPIYQAYTALTAKITEQDKIEPIVERKSDRKVVDPTLDDLGTAIAKLGGLNKKEAIEEWGIDPAENGKAAGKLIFRKSGGLSREEMAEKLSDLGYLSTDENGKHDLREFEEKLDDQLRGKDQFSTQYEPSIELRAGDQVVNPESLNAMRFDEQELLDMALPAEVTNVLKARKMVAKTGLHPDIVADLFGFSSGDELTKKLAEVQAPNDAIEALTDVRMLEQHGELATPDAIQRAADLAIHNDVRARMVATEANALASATGQRKVLREAAKSLAEETIARKKVRDVQPSQFTYAEARAAKSAEQYQRKGDLPNAAAEKRNQLFNLLAAKAAMNARDEIEKGLKYLKKFNGEVKIDPDYMDQIAAILDRFDLRKISNKEADRRSSLGKWLESQQEQGFEPDIPDAVRNELTRKPYKELTVEEFRGLVDTIKQIEHLGRLKKKLLTAKDQREYEAVRDEIVNRITEVADGRTADTRTPTTNMGRAIQAARRFGWAHVKVANLARILDGSEGGPVWEYLIRPANERGDWETTMRAQATEALTKIMNPVFDQGKMGGAGQYFESVGRSFNRGARIAIALNTGNAGNLQRLLGGEGWSVGQIMPILESLTADELHAVQAIWDHMETYRPLIAAKERRVYGKEPNWVEPQPYTVTSSDGVVINMRGGYYPIKYDANASQRAEEHSDAEAAKRQLQGAYTSATTQRSFTKQRVEEVSGRPLVYTLTGVFSGVNDVIHDLAWHEWLIDANRLLKSQSIDSAIRTHYGPEVKKQFKTWSAAIAEGEKGADSAVDMGLSKLRQGISVAGLGFNVMTAVTQGLGFNQSISRVGAQWIGMGVRDYLASPIQLTEQVNEMSEFMANRARTRFRELNELENRVHDQMPVREKIAHYSYWLMMRAQQMVDTPTWWGAYNKSIEAGNDVDRAISLADQAVIDSQGSGMVKDLSAIERGGQAQKIFTVFYSYMNTALNLGVNKAMTEKSRAKLAADMLLLYTVPAVMGYMLKAALTPSNDDWDEEKLAKGLISAQIDYLMGLMVLVREFSEAAKLLTGTEDHKQDYQGPAGLRAIADTGKFAYQLSQGEFDTAFRKSAVNLLGDSFGLPAAQINRTWSGVEALAEGKTSNPTAIAFGFKEQR